MTDKEKAKAYDEAIKRAKEWEGNPAAIDYLFPELAESNGEKVRKALIEMVHDTTGDELWLDYNVHKEETLDWLEKQGEHANFRNKIQVGDKVTRNEAGVLVNLSQLRRVAIPSKKQGEKSADTVEPKFREGEWITNGDYTWIIVGVKPLDYVLQSQDGNIVDDTISHVDEQFHSFTVEDAKDGDVLATSAGAFIYNGNNGGGSCPGCYCGIDTLGRFKTGVEHHWTVKKVYPATKEQRTELFLKMHEAGYEWDVEKKELKKIEENNGNIGGISPNWSEEDDWMKKKIMLVLLGSETFLTPEETNELVYWLKSLKGRVQPKQEWSWEDVIMKGEIINVLQKTGNYEKEIDWLKSLKDRVQQKQEWGEDDKRRIDRIYSILRQAADTHAFSTSCRLIGDKECMELQDFLKSLIPQSGWKPSEGDIIILEKLIKGELEPKVFQATLQGILEQLKKL